MSMRIHPTLRVIIDILVSADVVFNQGIFKIIQQFLLHKYSNTLTHAFLVMNDLSAADLVHADFCQT